jgi:hypothetical protein
VEDRDHRGRPGPPWKTGTTVEERPFRAASASKNRGLQPRSVRLTGNRVHEKQPDYPLTKTEKTRSPILARSARKGGIPRNQIPRDLFSSEARTKPAPFHETCHLERSGCSAKRSSRAVERPLHRRHSQQRVKAFSGRDGTPERAPLGVTRDRLLTIFSLTQPIIQGKRTNYQMRKAISSCDTMILHALNKQKAASQKRRTVALRRSATAGICKVVAWALLRCAGSFDSDLPRSFFG